MGEIEGLDAEQLALLRQIFRDEALEHVEALTQAVLAIEKGGAKGPSKDLVDDMLRRAHSLKGSSASVGLEAIGEVCHDLESLFKKLRSHPAKAGDAADAMLAALDWVKEALDRPDADRAKVVRKQLVDALGEGSGASREAAPASAPQAAAPQTETPAAAPTDASASIEAARARPAAEDDSVRIGMGLLDGLLDEADNLLILRLRQQQLAEDADSIRAAVEDACKALDAQDPARPAFVEARKKLDALERRVSGAAHYMGILLNGLRDRISEIRMVPVELALEPLRRVVRDLARRQEKDVELTMSGVDVRLDKKLVELIKDPLVHLVRNSIDHGCDLPAQRTKAGKPASMTISIRADASEGAVVLEITDDGKGIDARAVRAAAVKRGALQPSEADALSDEDALDLVFLPGLSTAKTVTDVSGRGVGLDVVRHNVSRLGGSVRVASEPGVGTRFTLTIPLTISATRGLLVRAGDGVWCIPLAAVEEITQVSAKSLGSTNGRSYLILRDHPIAFASLRSLLALGGSRPEEARFAVVLRSAERTAAVGLDEILGEQEIVVKPLPPQLERVWGLVGATTLGDRTLVAVLDVRDLVEGALAESAPRRRTDGAPKRRILVADDTTTTRMLVATVLEGAGYEVEQAVDGAAAFEALTRGGADAVVSDVEMPRMTGLELTRRIRASDQWRNLPIVLVSARGSQEDLQNGSEAGADAYIVKKDFAGPRLLDVVRGLLPEPGAESK